MSLNYLTKYHFSNEYGITGTLAADPLFSETKEGKPYAKFAIYCKSQDSSDSSTSRRSGDHTKAKDIPLIAYVRVFNEALLESVESLKKGYFVNFTYDEVTWNLGEVAETNTLCVNPSFVANTLRVRHVPGAKKEAASHQKSEPNGKYSRAERTRYYREN